MRFSRLIWFLILIVVAAACDPQNDSREPTPTVPVATATITPTLAFSATPTEPGTPRPPTSTFPPSLTPSLSPTPAPPSPTNTWTPTPGPFEYVVKRGEDCATILYNHGHRNYDQLPEFYTLNGKSGCNISEGERVLVPRPRVSNVDPAQITPSPTPPSLNYLGGSLYALTQYCVQENDTLTSIALLNNTTLQKVCELNRLPDGIDCSGCDFSQSTVGSCPRPPVLTVGKCLNVPGPTPTPTNTPTPSGSETPTPTPTYRPPMVVNPADGAAISGTVRLQWVSSALLQDSEYYVVRMVNETTGMTFDKETKATSIEVPADFFQLTSQPQTIRWFISVEALTPDGLFMPIGGRTPDYRFTWQ